MTNEPLAIRAIRPGRGVLETSELCGTVKFAVGCSSSCGSKPRLVYHNCMNITCPTCYHGPIKQQASRIDERMSGLYDAYRDQGTKLGTLKHIMFSPPQEDWPFSRFQDRGQLLMKRLRTILKKYSKNGAFAGTLILHLWRKKHLDGSECERSDRGERCRKKHQWVWGPHVHFIGYGYFEVSGEVHEKTGWVYKNIKPGQERDVHDTAFYLLTHMAVFVGIDGKAIGQTYRYVGLFANCNGGHERVRRTWEVERCEKCDAELHQYAVTYGGKIDFEVDLGASCVPVDVVRWYVRKRKPKEIQQRLEGAT